MTGSFAEQSEAKLIFKVEIGDTIKIIPGDRLPFHVDVCAANPLEISDSQSFAINTFNTALKHYIWNDYAQKWMECDTVTHRMKQGSDYYTIENEQGKEIKAHISK